MSYDNPETCRTAFALRMKGTYEAVTPRVRWATPEQIERNAEELLRELRADRRGAA